MATDTYTYPFDPTGINPANKITNEQQVLTAVNARDYHTIMPAMAPFFVDGLVLTFKNPDGSTRTLSEGVDYYFTHNFISASRACSKPVYGSITFLDNTLAGVVKLTYQTIGGMWTLDSNAIAEILANLLANPRTTAWEQITDIPVMFPVIDHEWNLVDMVGVSDLISKMDEIRDAILSNTGGGLAAHVADTNNPHQVTKNQVGLGNVQNYPIATETQATGGTNNTTYMTPLLVKKAIDAFGGGSGGISAHLTDYNNPHQVTKSQVGLGNVQNYGVADNAAMSQGTASNLYTTPVGVRYITDPILGSLNSHVADSNNPHNVTKDQVGLYNVQNYSIATSTDATDGTSNVKYMTPLLTKYSVQQFALNPLNDHISNASNPHAVSKGQVGLSLVQNYGISTNAQAVDENNTSSYMTPATTFTAIQFFVGDAFISHLNATNPHNVTAGNVGLGNVDNYATATTDAEQSTGVVDRFITPDGVFNMISKYAGSGAITDHIGNFDNPHQVTAGQTGAYLISEVNQLLTGKLDTDATAYDSARLGGLTSTEIVDQIRTDVTAVIPSVAAEEVTLMGYAADAGNPNVFSWIKLGTVNVLTKDVWDPAEAQSTYSDIHWIVTGGEPIGYQESPAYQIRAGVKHAGDGGWMTVLRLTDLTVDPVDFFYIFDTIAGNSVLTIYAKVSNGSSPLSVVSLHRGGTDIDIQFMGATDPGSVTGVTATKSYQQQIDALSSDIVTGFANLTTMINSLQ